MTSSCTSRTLATDKRSVRKIPKPAPMSEVEEPVVRPYLLVDDIGAAVRMAEEAGIQ